MEFIKALWEQRHGFHTYLRSFTKFHTFAHSCIQLHTECGHAQDRVQGAESEKKPECVSQCTDQIQVQGTVDQGLSHGGAWAKQSSTQAGHTRCIAQKKLNLKSSTHLSQLLISMSWHCGNYMPHLKSSMCTVKLTFKSYNTNWAGIGPANQSHHIYSSGITQSGSTKT
jgi:hypothetical protein